MGAGEVAGLESQQQAVVARREAAFPRTFEPGREPGDAEMQRLMADDPRIFEARATLARLLGAQARLQTQITEATDEELDAILKATGYEARINDALKQRAEELEELRTMRPEMAGPGVLPGTRASRLLSPFLPTHTPGARAGKGGLA